MLRPIYLDLVPRLYETVSQPCRRSAARSLLPLDGGLTPTANTTVAATRLIRGEFLPIVPPPNGISGCDTVSIKPGVPAENQWEQGPGSIAEEYGWAV